MNEKEWDEYIDDNYINPEIKTNQFDSFSFECSRITLLFLEADRKQKENGGLP